MCVHRVVCGGDQAVQFAGEVGGLLVEAAEVFFGGAELGAGAAPEAKSAEASELQRLSRANFPNAPGGRPASTATPATARPRPPQRGNDVSR